MGREGRAGTQFLDGHPFARDLDLFGPGSLFELLNTTRTDVGEETLADWLRSPAAAAEIAGRQQSVDELRPLLDLREDIAVLAAEADVGRTGKLAEWTAAPSSELSRAARAAVGGQRSGNGGARRGRVFRTGLVGVAARVDRDRGRVRVDLEAID